MIKSWMNLIVLIYSEQMASRAICIFLNPPRIEIFASATTTRVLLEFSMANFVLPRLTSFSANHSIDFGRIPSLPQILPIALAR